MKLVEILKKQVEANFIGKINVMLEESRQLIGRISLDGQRVVDCSFHGRSGNRALYDLAYFLGVQRKEIMFIAEAEKIDQNLIWKGEKIDIFEKKLSEYQDQISKAPPEGVKLIPKGDFILEGASISFKEFSLLEVISDYSTLQEIFNNSGEHLFDTLKTLVSLRKKGALKVLGRRASS